MAGLGVSVCLCTTEYIKYLLPPIHSSMQRHTLLRPLLALCLLQFFALSLHAAPMKWRGLMLDSGRQYQSVGTIESVIDSMAVRGMNTFHWHLTENDGWRMALRCAPRLTEVGAFVAGGAGQQGFYTRRQMKHIVRYARQRGITVVPEIDLPGHSAALIAAYPQYGCSRDVVCPANAELLAFLKGVLDEVCSIFPSPYIHLGGDEVDHAAWRRCPDCQRLMRDLCISDEASLQVWFERQLIDHLKTLRRTAVLWEDVLYETSAPLPDNLIVQWWNYRTRGDLGLREALGRGIPVVLSSNYYCYLNFPETPWAGYGPERTCTIENVRHNPSYEAYDAANPLILGMEACLWTDYNLTEDLLYDRLFPRLDILARQMQSPKP